MLVLGIRKLLGYHLSISHTPNTPNNPQKLNGTRRRVVMNFTFSISLEAACVCVPSFHTYMYPWPDSSGGTLVQENSKLESKTRNTENLHRKSPPFMLSQPTVHPD